MVLGVVLILAENLVKEYRIRTTLSYGSGSSFFGRLLFGESFSGRVVLTRLRALNHVSFRVDEPCILGLVGVNGSGKTTLLKVMAGLVIQDEGSIRILGEERPVRRSTRVTPIIDVNLNPYMTGRQNLEYLASFFNICGGELSSRVRSALSTVELEDRADDRVLRYSSGMAARLRLALALVLRRPILLLDDVLSNIDPQFLHRFLPMLRRMVASGVFKCVVISDQNWEILRLYSDRILMLHSGRVLWCGGVEELEHRIPRCVVEVRLEKPLTMELARDVASMLKGQVRLFRVDEDGSKIVIHSDLMMEPGEVSELLPGLKDRVRAMVCRRGGIRDLYEAMATGVGDAAG